MIDKYSFGKALGKQAFPSLLKGMYIGTNPIKGNLAISSKITYALWPFDPGSLLLETCPKEILTEIQKRKHMFM